MKSIWKWILGIVAVLVLCAALGGLGFIFTRSYGFGLARAPIAAQSGPANGFNGDRWRMPMHRGFIGPGGFGHMGMRGGYGFTPFGMGFTLLAGFFRLLIPLALIALVALGGYALGRRSSTRAPAPASVPPPESPAAPPAEIAGKDGEETPK